MGVCADCPFKRRGHLAVTPGVAAEIADFVLRPSTVFECHTDPSDDCDGAWRFRENVELGRGQHPAFFASVDELVLANEGNKLGPGVWSSKDLA